MTNDAAAVPLVVSVPIYPNLTADQLLRVFLPVGEGADGGGIAEVTPRLGNRRLHAGEPLEFRRCCSRRERALRRVCLLEKRGRHTPMMCRFVCAFFNVSSKVDVAVARLKINSKGEPSRSPRRHHPRDPLITERASTSHKHTHTGALS